MMNRPEKRYEDMTAEELQQELREAFLDTDIIDEPLNDELEKIREALNRKRPVEYLYTPEESWARFLEKCADEEELARSAAVPAQTGETAKPRRRRAALRTALIAAAVVVLLAGAALAAGPLGLWAWVRGWSDTSERYAQTGSGSPDPILEALEELGITEPVYPAWLPKDYVLTEAHINQDPLLLYELYTRSDRFLSITVMSRSIAESAAHPREDRIPQEYRAGEPPHYLFSNDGTITIVWYTENYFTSISGNITSGAMKRIADSINGN